MIIMWDELSRKVKNIGCWIVSKNIKYYNVCTKLNNICIGSKGREIACNNWDRTDFNIDQACSFWWNCDELFIMEKSVWCT